MDLGNALNLSEKDAAALNQKSSIKLAADDDADYSLYVGGINGASPSYAARSLFCAGAGGELTAAQVSIVYNIVLDYRTDLGL